MLKTCVVVADRARARLFVTVPGAERSVTDATEELLELEALTDPDGELTGEQLFSNTRSGTNRSPHGAQFEYDDHRAAHREQQERRFAKRVASAIRQRLTEEGARKLVLAVEPHMLGLLRHSLATESLDGAERVELAKDFSRHTPRHIHEALVRCGALAAAVQRA